MSGEDMRIEVVTLFPEFVGQAVRVGVLGPRDRSGPGCGERNHAARIRHRRASDGR
jgi:hypothetical protein